MNDNERMEVCDAIESEGFDYAFTCYSLFSHIKDKKFHELRQAYLDATRALEDYLKLNK